MYCEDHVLCNGNCPSRQYHAKRYDYTHLSLGGNMIAFHGQLEDLNHIEISLFFPSLSNYFAFVHERCVSWHFLVACSINQCHSFACSCTLNIGFLNDIVFFGNYINKFHLTFDPFPSLEFRLWLLIVRGHYLSSI